MMTAPLTSFFANAENPPKGWTFLFLIFLLCTPAFAQDLYRLKVKAAETAGLDTTRAFRDGQAEYHRNLVRSYLTDKEAEERAAKEYYKKLEVGNRKPEAEDAYEVLVEEYFIRLPQNVSAATLHEAEVKMDSVYQEIRNQKTGNPDFSSSWVGRLQRPQEFEEMAFSLPIGETSRPFFTPQGLHIIKVLDRRELPPFEEMKEEIVRRQTHSYAGDRGAQAAVERLKKEYAYTPDNAGINELLSKGTTDRTLFTLDGKRYGGREFALFATTYPAKTHRQLEAFTAKSMLDYSYRHIDGSHPELCAMLQAHRDSLLVAAITEREVEQKIRDEAGVQTYFDAHRADYRWDVPRFKGIVLHCTTKRVAKQVRKFLKQLPEKEWPDAIRLAVNGKGAPEVQAEQGLFAEGDNAFVDEQVFKRGKAVPVTGFPYTVVKGRKQKGPDRWQEVRDKVVGDYRDYLQAAWEASLLKNR